MKSILYKRILAFFIDFIPLCVVFTLILNFVMEKTEKSLLELTNNGVYYAVLLSVGLLSMLKDIFNGASIGKHIVKKITSYRSFLGIFTVFIIGFKD